MIRGEYQVDRENPYSACLPDLERMWKYTVKRNHVAGTFLWAGIDLSLIHILFHRRHGRFDGDGEEFVSVCPLAAGGSRLAGVHFECRFTAGMVVSR